MIGMKKEENGNGTLDKVDFLPIKGERHMFIDLFIFQILVFAVGLLLK